MDEEIKTSAFRYDSMKAAEGKRMFSFVYAKELSPNNFPYSLSFSPSGSFDIDTMEESETFEI